jgi:hypothetical protein
MSKGKEEVINKYQLLEADKPKEEIYYTQVRSDSGKLKISYFILVFIVLSLTTELFQGYKIGLVALFTEKGMASERRGILGFSHLLLHLRLLLAPLNDKFFFSSVGQRKTYLYSTKAIFTVIFFVGSFYIDSWVTNQDPYSIFWFSLTATLTSMFEVNSIHPFVTEVFSEFYGATSAVNGISNKFGRTLGMNIFSALNSRKMCKKLFGREESLVTHRQFFLFICILNLVSLLLLLLIKERRKEFTKSEKTLNPFRVFGQLATSKFHWLLLFTVAAASFPLLILRNTSIQYFVKAGAPRGELVFWTFIKMVGEIISPLLFLGLTLLPGMTKKLIVSSLILLSIHMVNLPNYLTFHSAEDISRVMIVYVIVMILDSINPAPTLSATILIRGCSEKYRASYLAAIECFSNMLKSFPVTTMAFFVDYIPLSAVYVGAVVIMIVYAFIAWQQSDKIDSPTPKEIARIFDDRFESENKVETK